MSTRLERYVWMTTIAVVALSVALLAMLPAVAEAQAEGQEQGTDGAMRQAERQSAYYEGVYENGATSAGRRVVIPGDSLWAIAQEQLGPNAAPEWVANEVERIHWLNRDRIGDDPNLILVGQELTLPPAARPVQTVTSEPVPASEPAPTTSEPAASEPAAAADEPPSEVSTETSTEEASTETPTEEASTETSTEEASAEQPAVLPELPEADAELVAASVEEPSAAIPEGDGDARRKAGYAVLLTTFAVALLGTARLLAKRH